MQAMALPLQESLVLQRLQRLPSQVRQQPSAVPASLLQKISAASCPSLAKNDFHICCSSLMYNCTHRDSQFIFCWNIKCKHCPDKGRTLSAAGTKVRQILLDRPCDGQPLHEHFRANMSYSGACTNTKLAEIDSLSRTLSLVEVNYTYIV